MVFHRCGPRRQVVSVVVEMQVPVTSDIGASLQASGPDRLLGVVSGWAFLLLLPGFFLYHTAIARGLIPPFLGGLSGTVGAALAPILLGLYIWSRPRVSLTGVLFWVIMALNATVALSHFLVGPLANDSELFLWSAVGVAVSVTFFFIGNRLPLNHKGFLNACLVGLFLMVAITIFLSEDHAFYTVRTSGLAELEDVSSHQGFANSIAIVGVVLIAAYSAKTAVRLAVLGVALIGVFLSGARTELVLLVVSCVFMFLLEGIAKRRLILRVGLSGVVLAGVVASLIALETTTTNRMFGLIYMSDDESARMRGVFSAEAWETISENPLLGDYMAYAQGVAGGVGNYAHNLLSAWVNLGLPGFLLYCATLSGMLVFILRGVLEGLHGNLSLWRLSALLAAYVVVGMMFSKAYMWPMFGLACGVVDRWTCGHCDRSAVSGA